MAADRTSLSAGIVIRHLLLSSDRVAALTSRVFPVAEDDNTGSYVVYRRVSREYNPVKQAAGPDTVSVELLCCAEDYDASLLLAEAVSAALNARSGECAGLRMRSCYLADSEEDWAEGCYVQKLVFTLKIS